MKLKFSFEKALSSVFEKKCKMSHSRSTRACSGVIYGIFQASQNFLPHFLWQSTTKSDLYPIMSVPTTQEREIWITSPLNWILIGLIAKLQQLAPLRHNLDDVHNTARMPNLPGNLLPAKNLFQPLPTSAYYYSSPLSHVLKVRKSQKEIVVSSITTKHKRKHFPIFLFDLFQMIGQKLGIFFLGFFSEN